MNEEKLFFENIMRRESKDNGGYLFPFCGLDEKGNSTPSVSVTKNIESTIRESFAAVFIIAVKYTAEVSLIFFLLVTE